MPALPYSNPGNYVRYSESLSREMAASEPRGVLWANQFDNVANREAHIKGTGPELWRQTEGQIYAFTCAVGTGGTLAGVGMALKERNHDIKIVLSDPMGAGLYNWYTNGEMKAEGNSITEGIGQSRITANLVDAPIDWAEQIPDEEMLPVVFSLLKDEGLCLGGSTEINVAGAIRVARKLGPGHTVVTILCDGGSRYQSKLFNPTFLRERQLPVPDWLV